ncbi:hypothetical protein [Sulfurihydrogenibium sp.]|uniref:hypothetical protein n=1 Tax=Sulfurihydrogenibium sp. TaxID=2053621 RepID=UPI0026156D71|nr:hypothetical protein [Sulfurihydrogenibium sp.]
MKKLIIAGVLTAGLLTSCSSVGVVAKMDSMEKQKVEQLYNAKKSEVESKVDKERLEYETKERSVIIDKAKTFVTDMPVAIGAGLLGGGNSITGNVLAHSALIIKDKLLEERWKEDQNSYAIIPMEENKDITTEDKTFQVIIKSDNQEYAENFAKILGFNRHVYLFKSPLVNLTEEEHQNKLVFYVVEFKGDPTKWTRIKKGLSAPFINVIADVIIDGKLAGRYLLYGNALRALFYANSAIGFQVIPTVKYHGFLTETVPNYIKENKETAKKE